LLGLGISEGIDGTEGTAGYDEPGILLREGDADAADTCDTTEGDRLCMVEAEALGWRDWRLALRFPMLEETLMMSLPWTTTSLDPDFLSSVVSISKEEE